MTAKKRKDTPQRTRRKNHPRRSKQEKQGERLSRHEYRDTQRSLLGAVRGGFGGGTGGGGGGLQEEVEEVPCHGAGGVAGDSGFIEIVAQDRTATELLDRFKISHDL